MLRRTIHHDPYGRTLDPGEWELDWLAPLCLFTSPKLPKRTGFAGITSPASSYGRDCPRVKMSLTVFLRSRFYALWYFADQLRRRWELRGVPASAERLDQPSAGRHLLNSKIDRGFLIGQQ